MKRRVCIGNVEKSQCRISNSSPNGHVLSVGLTGSGKSVRNEEIELNAAKDGLMVIVIDINSSRSNGGVSGPMREEYLVWINQIDAKKDGLPVTFLKPMQNNDGSCEDYVKVVNSAVSSLSAGHKMGIRQETALRKAVAFAMNHCNDFPDEMMAIGEGLLRQDDSVAEGVYYKLWTVFNSKIFRPSVKRLHMGMVNVISFTDMDKLTQAAFVTAFISYLWRAIKYLDCFKGKEIVLSIDEFQNLPLGEGSVLRDILREGRKFGINLLLATQTLSVFNKDVRTILNQTGTKLYFRQAVNEINAMSKEIDPQNRVYWASVLSSLRVGEAIAVGSFCANGCEINHPILTK